MSKFSKNEIKGVGLGLRHPHVKNFIEDKPAVPWLEVHTENYFSPGTSASKFLLQIRQDYALSMHCVGLSLGSFEVGCPVRDDHLQKVKETYDRYEPALVSDHLSWSASQAHYIPDLLPVPMTEEALEVCVQNVDRAQEVLGRQMLIENPSAYASFKDSPIPEWEFLSALAERTGCGLLLDVNNIYVTAHNHNLDADEYLHKMPVEPVKEIHLAGYTVQEVEGQEVYVDTHGHPVYDDVWALYEKAVARFGDVPTLIEWDTDIPELSVLMDEKFKADKIFAAAKSREAA